MKLSKILDVQFIFLLLILMVSGQDEAEPSETTTEKSGTTVRPRLPPPVSATLQKPLPPRCSPSPLPPSPPPNCPKPLPPNCLPSSSRHNGPGPTQDRKPKLDSTENPQIIEDSYGSGDGDVEAFSIGAPMKF